MAYNNNISTLINKIEKRLGLIPLTPSLPKEFNKDEWAKVITTDTLLTFSRYYPYKYRYLVDDDTPKVKGVYYLDEDLIGPSAKILGISDIAWEDFSNNGLSIAQQFGYGLPDVGMMNFSVDDIASLAMRANYASLFNNGIYPEFEYPNKLRLKGIGNQDVQIGRFTIDILLVHPDTLVTISPTKMEIFEQLAQADIAGFLFRGLRYYDGLQTVNLTIDLKLNELESEYGKRENILDKLEQNYVSAGNDSIPLIITV